MATKGVKIFKFTDKQGNVFRMKFYSTGVYTITDRYGEHEKGMWEKKPMLVGKHHKPSKDPNSVVYFGTSFTRAIVSKGIYRITQYTMRELAQILFNWEYLHFMD